MWDVSVMTTHRNPSLYTYGTIDWDRMLSNLIVAYAGKLRCESCNRSMVNLIKESISGKMLCIDCIIQKSKSLNKSRRIRKSSK
jgi:formylmethanofuran dehydrogenase subunit E